MFIPIATVAPEFNRPFTANGFGGWFRDRCDEAGLPQCSAHGLRKAGAALAAENRASVHELMAIFGWLTMKEAERYTQRRDASAWQETPADCWHGGGTKLPRKMNPNFPADRSRPIRKRNLRGGAQGRCT